MSIPTEPIGSIPRPEALMEGVRAYAENRISKGELDGLYEDAVRDTIQRFEATGSPVITDGEQTKPSFATYPVHGQSNVISGGVTIRFADSHTRQLPRLIAGPFRYGAYAAGYLEFAKRFSHVPVKQAVISASALSLLYPQEAVEGYSKEEFLQDLTAENEKDIRKCLDAGAYNVQIDFTEGRLAVKLDRTRLFLKSLIDLNNQVLGRFSSEQRKRIGIHTCPGGDQDSTHSADVDYADFLPELFQLMAGNFYIQLASEKDPEGVLKQIKEHSKPDQKIFIGVTDPIRASLETPELVKERILRAARYIPLERLGSTDDCGFSPFGDDLSTSRETAFAKIQARVEGTRLAAQVLGV
jgi:5-methyltetrahydropteroyltriglutamate--homocysteine methyltransferase